MKTGVHTVPSIVLAPADLDLDDFSKIVYT